MKINLASVVNPVKDLEQLLRKIIVRTILLLSLLVFVFYVGTKLSEQVGENYLKSHFHININSFQQGEIINLPSQNSFATMDLKEKTFDNYIDITFSGGDVYKVEFLLDDESDFIIISTVGNGDKSYLYLIPEVISNKGFDQIYISPMGGDGDYWLQNVDTHLNADLNNFPGYEVVNFEIKKMAIEIGEKEFSKIKDKRMEALDLGILLTGDEDFVPAVIYAEGKKDDIDIRLKGDWTDHLKEKKWSFRIKMDNECLWGMKDFSIQRPETRKGVAEYLIHEFYRKQGGIALRYDFVDVVINGEYWGVYALEEFFDKRLIESSLRREGPIIKPNEDYLWERWAYYSNNYAPPYLNFIEFDVFGKNTILNDALLYESSTYAITLLNKLLTNEIEVNDVFDLDMHARYLAAVDIFYACHGNIWHNMRYYFNPITAKLEPITFDEEPTLGLCSSSSKKNDPLITPLFYNDEFVTLYVHYVDKYLKEYDDFIESEKEKLEQIKYIFRRNLVLFEDFSSILDDYHEYIQASLYENDVDFYIEPLSTEQIGLTIRNEDFLNIHLKEIAYDGRPLPVEFSDYSGTIKIEKDQQDLVIDDLSKIEITYQTLHDNQTYRVNAKVNKPELTFYVAGHVYGDPQKGNTPEQDKMHPPFVNALQDIANDEAISFGILTGDTVFQPSEKSYENLIATMSRTGKPYYVVPGNHDLDGSGVFEKYFQYEYQAFVENSTLFILLTPRQDWSIDNEQMEFLVGVLDRTKWDVSNIFIFTHQLFWLEQEDERFPGVTPNSWANKENESNFWGRIKPLFSNYRGGVYFIAGDVGAFADKNSIVYEQIDNLHLIASGMGGGVADNYLVVNVYSNATVQFNLIALNGDDPNVLGSIEDW